MTVIRDVESFVIQTIQSLQTKSIKRPIPFVYPPEGIGDDGSVLLKNFFSKNSMVISKDLLVEGTHFRSFYHPPQWLGQKVMVVNLSDMAAMGAKPKAVYLGLGLPQNFLKNPHKKKDQSWFYELVKGMMTALQGVPLLGGDTVRSSQLFFSVTILGEQDARYIKYRSCRHAHHKDLPEGIQEGDVIAMTDVVGGSQRGLELLESYNLQHNVHDHHKGKNDKKNDKDEHWNPKKWKSFYCSLSALDQAAIKHHLCPRASLDEAAYLAIQRGVVSMMDLSDGLVRDLPRLAMMNQCRFHMNLEEIPLHPSLFPLQENYLETACLSGEEYSLLVIIKEKECSKIQKKFFKLFHRPLYKIGHVEKLYHRYRKNCSDVDYFYKNKKIYWKKKGFDHFE